MLEGLVTWVLNNYLEKYVENLNTDQLSIAILSGEVELENLPLRRDALRHLGIPIEIRTGHIGKVKLQIPIRSLRSSPWLLIIERLYLVATPLVLEEWDQTAEDFAEQERKLAALDAIEACWRFEADGNVNSSYASSYSSWLSYGTGVITDIIENIQLHIKDVHFRFEDTSSIPDKTIFICGLTIETLSAQSCDQNWQPQFMTHRDNCNLSFKTIELKNLAVYWDSHDSPVELTSKLTPNELANVLSEKRSENHRYIVAPVSACAKLQRNRSEQPLKSVHTPRIVCDLNLDQVLFSFIDWQYEQMVCCMRGLEFLYRIKQHRRCRPVVKVAEDPKAWWWYACNSQLPGGLHHRLSWDEMLERARENVQYVELYTKWLTQPTAALGMDVKRLKDSVEWSRDFDELKSLREIAMRRASFENSQISTVESQTDSKNSSQGRNVLVRWFPQWWGWHSASEQENIIVSPPTNSAKLENEILEALADSAKNNTLLRRDVVFGKFNFALNGGLLKLSASSKSNDAGITMLEFQFSDLKANVNSRPRTSSFGVELRLGSLQLLDRLTPGTLFTVLVGPSTHHQFHSHNRFKQQTETNEPFFTLNYNSTSIPAVQKLHVSSKPLDVVYQPEAARWLLDFLCAPYQKSVARDRLHAMRCQLSNTWGSMLESRLSEQNRNGTWDIRLHISAPQIIIIENFCDPDAAIGVIDLGTLKLENLPHFTSKLEKKPNVHAQKSSPCFENPEDDEEMFMTPCSTPPGSETGEEDSSTIVTALSELSFHQHLYDSYNIELADIQIIVGHVRDNWRHAHIKGSSSLHVLDRFNISLQIEKRVVSTNDPMYPNFTLSANLPRLVAHVNEQKITVLRTLMKVISNDALSSPFNESALRLEEIQQPPVLTNNFKLSSEEEDESSKQLITLQFTVEQISLEVQSRGRSVAELQVTGVTMCLTRRPFDLSVTLTVHGLLLVDALQTFGADFELLVASHRHVAMDSMSGSLRDSEPTSPTSPASPDPMVTPRQQVLGSASSLALTQALSVVAVSPITPVHHHSIDTEVLISVELFFINGTEENLQIATIQFNNLDIIANQETIVELVGFLRRVSSNTSRMSKSTPQTTEERSSVQEPINQPLKTTRTELNFDFHRLSVLLLRAVGTTGRKIGTATMYEAKIQATVDSTLFIQGSLGGLQVLNLTPEGFLHQRIISVGRDPLGPSDRLIDFLSNKTDDDTAFSFSILRNLHKDVEQAVVEVSIKMASVWYIHSPQFLKELQSCATEFKQYLSDLARSLRSAATDVALGLVHARTEQLHHLQHNIGVGIYSPRRSRRRTSSISSTEPHTPYTPSAEDDYENIANFNICLDVVLDSPVVVLPHSSSSCHVLVAHLGKITVNNRQEASIFAVEVRDMNISTLDTSSNRNGYIGSGISRVENHYNCEQAVPILHNTLVHFQVTRRTIDLENLELHTDEEITRSLVEITGCVVNNLKVSLTRSQYEQLLDTLQNNTVHTQQPVNHILEDIKEENVLDLSGVSTLSMDPHVRAKLFPYASHHQKTEQSSKIKISFRFEVASFDVELCNLNGAGLVGLSFGDFLLKCTAMNEETQVHVSLRSLLVEDLLRDPEALRRQMIASKNEDNIFGTILPCVSHSCPPEVENVLFTQFSSLPDRLDTKQIFGAHICAGKHPLMRLNPKRSGEDLVLVNCRIESTKRTTLVELGSLDVAVSAKSWIPLLEFFSNPDDVPQKKTEAEEKYSEDNKRGSSTTTVSIRSLTLQTFNSDDSHLARARVAGILLDINRDSRGHRRIHGHLEVVHISDEDIQHTCRGERFVTIGKRALNFRYSYPADLKNCDSELFPNTELILEISPFVYVHTKKFVAQLRAFFAEFSQTKSNIKRKSTLTNKPEVSRMSLNLSADACVMLVPVKSGSQDVLVFDVGKLTAQNCFTNTEHDLQLDVTTWKLHQVDVYGAKTIERDIVKMNTNHEDALVFGDCMVLKRNQSLLSDKCFLEFRVDRNLTPSGFHRKTGVADLTINCRLSTLEVFLNLEDYTLIRGVLSYNLGEDTEHILPSVPTATVAEEDVWTLSSLRIELLDVKVHLNSLACINFIRSRLTVDSFSDLSQDVDLVSRQILIIDERKHKMNVFDVVLQPSSRGNSCDGTVQAEIHSRRRKDKNKFTVLLNNMRLMALADWWKLIGDFISTNYQYEELVKQKNSLDVPLELKLNITESEVVVVEDTTNADTNAVILQSTVLLSYRPNDDSEPLKPLSCSVNNLEVFSCRLNDEEATALSIIDPVTISIEIISNILDIQLQELIIRVSYRDLLMFAAILDSFRRQTASLPENALFITSDVQKLRTLGFSLADCEKALTLSDNKLDDAALWLTQNAVPNSSASITTQSSLNYKTSEFHASCIRFCLIDDCGEVDVPLAEVTLTNLAATIDFSVENSVETSVEASLTLDYYNRILGGWEPLVEPWKCRGVWRPDSNLVGTRHRLALHSDDLLDINVTDSAVSLLRLVRDSWTKDMSAPRTTPRCPFIPYSIYNGTGSILDFATLITDPDKPVQSLDDFELNDRQLRWQKVPPGVTQAFSYSDGGHSKRRHQESHQLRMHQLAVRVHGWQTCAPVTVDRVGVFFRSISPSSPAIAAPRPVRLIFDIRLDGSARKLVLVRSAMLLINRLPDAVDVKLVERSAVNAVSTASRNAVLAPGSIFPLPLIHTYSHVFIRPSMDLEYSYSQPDVPWARVQRYGDRILFTLRCTTNRGPDYHVCCDVRRDKFLQTNPAPGHTIFLLPVLLIVNLLPQDMHFVVTNNFTNTVLTKGVVSPGNSSSVPAADPDSDMEVSVHIENFQCTSTISIPSSTTPVEGEFTVRVRLEDTDRRRLFLQARVETSRGARVRVTVTAPYWVVNRTGLPLIFRQAGSTVGNGAAGQFEEHELARMVAPLLLSLTDEEPPALEARVGSKYKTAGSGETHWCQQFHLRRGVQVRRLKITSQDQPDTVYVVGIEIRSARGRRRHQHTNIVTISPRHQLHNRTPYKLEFAQACHTSFVTDPGAAAFRVHAPPGCNVPFHWPRLDREQLLCVRCIPESAPATCWTGGIRIDAPTSQHLLVRKIDTGVRFCFLHTEVIPHGAMYCLIVSEATGLPPPLRIDNYSEVALTFGQHRVGGFVTVAHALHSVPYAWDESTGMKKLVLTVPGSVSTTYDVDRLGRTSQLTYENFIYIAFIATFHTEHDLNHYNEANYSTSRSSTSPKEAKNPLEFQRLVLDVPEGSSRVVLSRKIPGARSQLWRMTSTGQLQHEGSITTALVLDLEAPAPQPSASGPAILALRRPDPRRRTTQTWRFTSDGRLCCSHRNTCVQALELRPGSVAVLGTTHPNTSPSPSQSVVKQRMRPGSGLLAVEITTDGPTRVIRITDMKQQQQLTFPKIIIDEEDWHGVDSAHRPYDKQETDQQTGELQITLMLRAGLGLSVIGNVRELLYLQLNNIISEIVCGSHHRELCLSVQDLQCDNQLLETTAPVLLHAARNRFTPSNTSSNQQLPVLEMRAEMNVPAGAVVIFKHLIVCVRSLAVHLEEVLILRLYEFLLTTIGQTVITDEDDDGQSDDNEEESDEQTITAAATLGATPTPTTITRYHFGIIRLVPGPLRLSVHTATASNLTPRLRTLKRRLGLTLVGFEDAPIELEPYVRHHPVETSARLQLSILSHFRDELLWQAATILGSVDFLGSPLGLLGDVTEGVSGLIRERSVGALVLNVAHGLSNSAAKVTETLGDGLGRVTMDEAHEEMRQRLRRRYATSGPDHIVAGFKGLGFGILGGVTGIFKQVYEGAGTDGLQGVFSGLGKGLVGAVAKPVVGVLDLATETARAVRDSSRSSSRIMPDRRRQPRATLGPGGLLPPYNSQHSIGQSFLRSLSKEHRYDSDSSTDTTSFTNNEQYVAYECVRSGTEDLRVLISSERIRVVTNPTNAGNLAVVTETKLSEVVACAPLTQPDGRHYIEITVQPTVQQVRRPLIRCDSERQARHVIRHINYAKRLYEEATHTLRSQDD